MLVSCATPPPGRFPGSDDSAVILLEKQPIAAEDLNGLFSRKTELSTVFRNDIYAQHVATCKASPSLGGLRVMSVYPATDAHIRKYSYQPLRMLLESPEDYCRITKPFVEKQAFRLEVGMN